MAVVTFALLAIVSGMALIEIVSYFWHKQVEHGGALGNNISYRHFLHHEIKYPTFRFQQPDPYQTVHPWSWYLIGAALSICVFYILPLGYAVCVAIGGAVWGWLTVKVHETFHIKNHWLNKYAWYRVLLRRHVIHHWSACNYGIILFGLDRLLGTLKDEMPRQKENNFPNYITTQNP